MRSGKSTSERLWRFYPRLGPALAICVVAGWAPATAQTHPLDPLTHIDYAAVLEALQASDRWSENTRLPLVTLDEPPKASVESWAKGDPARRRAFAVVKEAASTFEAVVDLAMRRVISWQPKSDVQPGILLTEDWETAQEVVRAHEGWRQAVRDRGIDDFESLEIVPLTAGYFGRPIEATTRLVKALSFDGRGVSNFWGRPLEGLIAVVDLDEKRVVELIDQGPVPVPEGPVDLRSAPREAPRAPLSAGPEPTSSIDGVELAGQFVRWRDWSFHWRIDPRLGPVLSLVRFGDGDAARSILYQASLSEMFVPYTDPSAGWYFRAYMDAGEYGLGKLASRLVPNLDCPSNATLLSTWFVDEWGNPYIHQRAACLFVRYTGDVAWRHFESVTGATEGRRLTELVFRTIPAVGNYDYVLDWVFRADGSIRVSVGATGVPQVKATARRGPTPDGQSRAAPPETARYGRWVAPHTLAVSHDHFFSFRLDLDVDGRANTFTIDRLKPVTIDDGGARSGTWAVETTVPASELDSRLRIDLERPALWRVANPAVVGATGYPVSYQLVPERNAVSLFASSDFVQRRAGFTAYHLWATPFERDERYAAGMYPNQSRGGDGLPRWTENDRPIVNRDIVLWYTLGMHHVVRAEDWPVVPTNRSGFELRPFDFFERNPVLELEE